MSKCDDTQLLASSDVPLWNKPGIPDDATVYMTLNEADQLNGGSILATYRIGLDRIIPTNQQNSIIYSLHDDQADIAVSTAQVVPAYVESFAPYRVRRAQAVAPGTSLAQFVIVSLDQNVDNSYIVQASGFHRFSEAHNYLVGQQYYLSDSSAGGVTNVAPAGIKQRLFIPVDEFTIVFNLSME